jgi:hypothetical protein
MDEAKLIQMLGSAVGGGAMAGALLLILYRMTSRIVERVIAAIDRIAASVDKHTATDLAHHAEVKEAVVRVEAKLDAERDARDRTPTSFPRVEDEFDTGRRHRTNPHGYRPPRPGGRDE